MRRALVGLLAIAALVAPVATQAQSSLGLFTASVTTPPSNLGTGQWSTFFLHNIPTPPTRDTNASADLPMDRTAPSASTLYNYDKNCGHGSPGRTLASGGSGPTDTGKCVVANWLTAPFGTAKVLSQPVVVDLWTGTVNFTTGTPDQVTAYLRDYDPATATYTEIANATLSRADWQAGRPSWVEVKITLAFASRTLPAGHELEVKLVDRGATSLWIAYDAIGQPSSVSGL